MRKGVRDQGSIRTFLLDSGLLRASARVEAAFQAQIPDRVIAPVVVAAGAAAVDSIAQCCELSEVVWLVDESRPVDGQGDRRRGQ